MFWAQSYNKHFSGHVFLTSDLVPPQSSLHFPGSFQDKLNYKPKCYFRCHSTADSTASRPHEEVADTQHTIQTDSKPFPLPPSHPQRTSSCCQNCQAEGRSGRGKLRYCIVFARVEQERRILILPGLCRGYQVLQKPVDHGFSGVEAPTATLGFWFVIHEQK